MTVFSGQWWHLDPPFTWADKRPLNQLTVKKLIFSLIIKTFCHWHQCVVHEKAIDLSALMKEICTLLVKLYIICSRMQRVNLHARPSIIQVGCPTCCYQVCALDHAKLVTADLDYHSEPCRHNELRMKLPLYPILSTTQKCLLSMPSHHTLTNPFIRPQSQSSTHVTTRQGPTNTPGLLQRLQPLQSQGYLFADPSATSGPYTI